MPTMPAQAPKIRYRVPMSLWLVEKSHRAVTGGGGGPFSHLVNVKFSFTLINRKIAQLLLLHFYVLF